MRQLDRPRTHQRYDRRIQSIGADIIETRCRTESSAAGNRPNNVAKLLSAQTKYLNMSDLRYFLERI